MMLKAALLTLLLAGTVSAEAVQGTVLEDHSGAPVTTASVKLKTVSGATLKETETDRSGRFVLADVPAGEYLVSVSKTNYASVNARMAAQGDSAQTPILRLIKFGVISGHVTSPRTGGAATAIEVVSDGQIPRSYSGTIAANGDFRIFGISPGRYQLAAPLLAATASEPVRGMALYPSNSQPREFAINGGEEFAIPEFTVSKDGASFISGKVTGPGTPQIFSLALVDPDHPSIRLMTALTAEGGAFHFDSILPGAYDLYATGPVTPAPSYFARVHLVLNSQRVENIELVLKPGRPVEFAMGSGKAVAPNVPCSSDGIVTLQVVGQWGFVRDMKLTAPISPSVPARIENVGPGAFNVSVRSTNGNCIGVTPPLLDLRKDAAPERATVVFQPLPSIHGSAAIGNVVVLRDLTPGHDSPVQAIFANSAAEFHFDGLAPGRYCVTPLPSNDPIPHWSPESGCSAPIIELAAGEAKSL
jgi:hypothetical protein